MAAALSWRDVKQYVRAREPPVSKAANASKTAAASWPGCDAEVEDERRRASVARNCVCLLLCALTAAAMSMCLGSALLGATAPSRYMETVVQQMTTAGAVEFAVEFKPAPLDHTRRGGSSRVRRREFQLMDASVVRVSGTLIPRISEDSGQLRFDGWMQIETNASERHEVVLANHRGYRTTRVLPSMQVVSKSCLGTSDIPPLHALGAIPHTAFRTAEFSAFGVNCTLDKPIEMLFMDVPFVFCAEQLVRAGEQQAALVAGRMEMANLAVPRTLAFHGERVVLRASLVIAKQKNTAKARSLAMEGSAESSGSGSGSDNQLEATTMQWSTKAKSMPESCAYLEAPLGTGREKTSFLYRLLPPLPR